MHVLSCKLEGGVPVGEGKFTLVVTGSESMAGEESPIVAGQSRVVLWRALCCYLGPPRAGGVPSRLSPPPDHRREAVVEVEPDAIHLAGSE